MSQLAADAEQAAHRDPEPETVVGAGVVVRGDIEGVTDLRVHGSISGRVVATHVVVDLRASVEGSITADDVVIAGRVTGPIEARSVHICSSAIVEGDVTCDSIGIEPGARFRGRCAYEDRSEAKVVPFMSAPEPTPGTTTQELLNIAARLRRAAEGPGALGFAMKHTGS